jgi:hypothetical protein
MGCSDLSRALPQFGQESVATRRHFRFAIQQVRAVTHLASEMPKQDCMHRWLENFRGQWSQSYRGLANWLRTKE